MDRMEIMNKLQEIFRDVFDDDTLALNEKMNASDVEGWDSLAQISILAAVQDEFSVKFEMKEIIAMKNVGDIVLAICNKMGVQA